MAASTWTGAAGPASAGESGNSRRGATYVSSSVVREESAHPRSEMGIAFRGRTLANSLLGATVTALALAPAATGAQAGTRLEGIVVEAHTGRSLEAVDLRIADTDFVLRTGEDGSFRFVDLPAGPLILTARLDGYVTFTDQILIQPGRVHRLEIRMETLGAVLEGLQVSAQRFRLRASEPAAPPLSGGELLPPHAMVTVFRPSEVGGGSAFLIRGVKTLTGRVAPAVFLDGIRVLDGGGATPSGGVLPSILDLIPAEAIDSIRVLRGPAAAARYGPGTANGVILVYTRRGWGSGL
jgi:TonB-dependent SusC/RagA subfamily outer membrane receptor